MRELVTGNAALLIPVVLGIAGCGRVPSPRVTGRVFTHAGAPVVGAPVLVVGTPFMTRTDSLGHFALDSIPKDLYGVQVRAHGYQVAQCPLQGSLWTRQLGCDVMLTPDTGKPDLRPVP